MDVNHEYERWRQHPDMDPELKEELDQIQGNKDEIEDRFGRRLAFGTGGIRGPMGAGTSRMNMYLIRKATAGLAAYLKDVHGTGDIAVAIAFDTRRNSFRFAKEAASVLSYQGISAWLFPKPTPTPLLSFAVRELKAQAGIVITASHNPPADNGYKVYGPDGGQITDGFAHQIMARIEQVEDELEIPVLDPAEAEAKGLLRWIPESLEKEYLEKVMNLSSIGSWWQDGDPTVKVVYTPLHGTGARHIPLIFERNPVIEGHFVPEQMVMDASCPTVKYPNPEDWEVYTMAESIGKSVQADLLMATDLDADRLGMAVHDGQGEYIPITGNQLGCLMLHYILSQRKKAGRLPANGIMVQTVVTSDLGKEIARSFGVEVVETLTGFKYIGEVIKEKVDHGTMIFLFGYEESYGYLVGDFVRDKDGIQAAMFASEVAAFYLKQGKTMHEALDGIYSQYGHYYEDLISISLPPGETTQIDRVMEKLRNDAAKTVGGSPLARVFDYEAQVELDCAGKMSRPIPLPKSNSWKAVTEDGTWFCVRPSGTEPKMKIYFGVRGDGKEAALIKKKHVEEEIRRTLGI